MSDAQNLNKTGLSSFIEMQHFILESQSKNIPFFIGRLSGNEPNLCGKVYTRSEIPNQLLQNMLFVAGIKFTSKEDLEKYVKIYTESFFHCDMVGVWTEGSMKMQSQLLCDIIRPQLLRTWVPICATGIEPYYYMNDPRYEFYNIFKGRKVLILTSHSKTIKDQLSKIDKLFKTPIFHETTKFFVHKPPQQNGDSSDGRSWQWHFEKLKTDINQIKNGGFDFDIALVSCGGFGMPICNFIRTDLGKSVIYVGGALQLFFGVMGSRWDSSDNIKLHVNELWTRPLEIDKPSNPAYCENSCYW